MLLRQIHSYTCVPASSVQVTVRSCINPSYPSSWSSCFLLCSCQLDFYAHYVTLLLKTMRPLLKSICKKKIPCYGHMMHQILHKSAFPHNCNFENSSPLSRPLPLYFFHNVLLTVSAALKTVLWVSSLQSPLTRMPATACSHISGEC